MLQYPKFRSNRHSSQEWTLTTKPMVLQKCRHLSGWSKLCSQLLPLGCRRSPSPQTFISEKEGRSRLQTHFACLTKTLLIGTSRWIHTSVLLASAWEAKIKEFLPFHCSLRSRIFQLIFSSSREEGMELYISLQCYRRSRTLSWALHRCYPSAIWLR